MDGSEKSAEGEIVALTAISRNARTEALKRGEYEESLKEDIIRWASMRNHSTAKAIDRGSKRP